MEDIRLHIMTRELCHEYFKEFQSDASIYMDMSKFSEYTYSADKVDKYFDLQQADDRIVFMIMLKDKPIGELKLKYIDKVKKECTLGIHLQNDSVKGKGYGTVAEKMALEYAFKELGMKAVNADAVLKNKRSQHILEKLGFKYLKEDEMLKYYRYEFIK